MCNHDNQYRIENEAAGGVGCPLCNAERSHQDARKGVQEPQGAAIQAYPVLEDTGACSVEICADCGFDCDELAAIEAQKIADWRDDFESQARPGSM